MIHPQERRNQQPAAPPPPSSSSSSLSVSSWDNQPSNNGERMGAFTPPTSRTIPNAVTAVSPWKHPAAMTTLNHYHSNPPTSVARKKLKILVLGGAGAGKTSILRRYFRGTFHQERIPTMGSDFYTRQIPNPKQNDDQEEEEEGTEEDDPSSTNKDSTEEDNNNINNDNPNIVSETQRRMCNRTSSPIQRQLQDEGDDDDGSVTEEKKVVDAACVTPPPPPPPSNPADGYRPPEAYHSSNNSEDPFASAEFISIQVWDTPGRERFTGPNRHKAKYTAAFSDKFFQNADAVLLVYDFTSSTSFTQLLHWHADLMERLQRLEQQQQQNGEQFQGRPPLSLPILIVANKMDLFAQQQQQQQLQRQAQIRQQQPHHNPHHGGDDYYSDNVPQRDVMGLKGNTFRGKDSRYEYRAGGNSNYSSTCSSPRHLSHGSLSPPSSTSNRKSSSTPTSPRSNSNNNKKKKKINAKRKKRFEISTYMGTGGQTSYLKAVLSNECARGSYLESLLSTEDRSHPDKDMVLLWCMRNGLKHVEVSALDGTGVKEMMDEAVKLAMESSTSRDANNNNNNKQNFGDKSCQQILYPPIIQQPPTTPQEPEQQPKQQQPEQQQQHQEEELQKQNGYYHYYRRNQELDLTERYAPKDTCWLWSCLTRGPFHFCEP